MSTLVDNDNNRAQFLCGVVEGFYGRPWSTGQRKELFLRMNRMGLNTYLYAPKDDAKHRSLWRELYSVEEAEHLTSLIESAAEHDVTFVYALSPGLDMTFSSAKEVTFLKKKLEQVSTFGCKAFALLFDDIEPELCEADKQVFQSFAFAQVSVTNETYQHLNQPKFLYCPTEYCASRAVPTVQKSEYLNTIGSKLLPDIDIMWTGPKVISKKITIESIEELSKVLKRPPVIWDNIHANDYDQKRLFLGPYHGRPTDLIPYLNGVLTNPNCEFEANYIALHTLAQWSKCNKGVKKDLVTSEPSPVVSDIKLEQEGELEIPEDDLPSLDGYCPKLALKSAIIDWAEEMYRRIDIHPAKVHVPTSGAPTDLPIVSAPVNTCMTITPTTNSVLQTSPLNTLPFTGITNANQLERLGDVNDSYMQPVSKEIVNSLVDASSYECNNLISPQPEPMDAEPVAGGSLSAGDGKACGDNEMKPEVMQVDNVTVSVPEDSRLTTEEISLLVDLFYLPFDHGCEAVKLMTDFHWLKTNSHVTLSKSKGNANTEQQTEWHENARLFGESVKRVSDMVDKLSKIPNRGVLYDLYPYVWDMRGVLGLLNSFVKWLGCTKGYKDAFISGEQEPWVFRGGLTGELQRMLPIDGAYDLFNTKPPETPTSNVLTIRPYSPADEAAVYDICLKTCDDGFDGSDVFAGHPQLIGDKLIGGFLTITPEYCFVLEDDVGICGYVLAARDAQAYYQKLKHAWIPAMCMKYEKPTKDDNLSPSEEVIQSFHKHEPYFPDNLYTRYPSLLTMSTIPHRVEDPSVPKRLLACVLSALKANGTHGVYTEIQVGDKYMLEFYSRLGFLDIPALDILSEEVVVLGRML